MSEDTSYDTDSEAAETFSPSVRATIENKNNSFPSDEREVIIIGDRDILTTASTDDLVLETDALFTVEKDDDYCRCIDELLEVLKGRFMELKRDREAANNFISGFLRSIIDVTAYKMKLTSKMIVNKLRKEFELIKGKLVGYEESINKAIDLLNNFIKFTEMNIEDFGDLADLSIKLSAIQNYNIDDFTASFTYIETTHKWIYQIAAEKREMFGTALLMKHIREAEELVEPKVMNTTIIKTMEQANEYGKQLARQSAVKTIKESAMEAKRTLALHQQAEAPEGVVTGVRNGNDYQFVEWGGR